MSQIVASGEQLSNSAKPNQPINASINIENNASLVLPGPNSCNLSSLTGGSGLSVKVAFVVNGNVVSSESHCVPGGGGVKTFTLSWDTPNVTSATTYQVEWRVSYAGTGDRITTVNRTVTVRPTAPAQPQPGQSGQPPTASKGTGGNVVPNVNLNPFKAAENAVGKDGTIILGAAAAGGLGLAAVAAIKDLEP